MAPALLLPVDQPTHRPTDKTGKHTHLQVRAQAARAELELRHAVVQLVHKGSNDLGGGEAARRRALHHDLEPCRLPLLARVRLCLRDRKRGEMRWDGGAEGSAPPVPIYWNAPPRRSECSWSSGWTGSSRHVCLVPCHERASVVNKSMSSIGHLQVTLSPPPPDRAIESHL